MAEQLAPNMSVDSYIACRKCKKRVYALYRVGVPGKPDIYTHRLWPFRDGGWCDPPEDPSKLVCPTCKEILIRLDPKVDPTKETI